MTAAGRGTHCFRRMVGLTCSRDHDFSSGLPVPIPGGSIVLSDDLRSALGSLG